MKISNFMRAAVTAIGIGVASLASIADANRLRLVAWRRLAGSIASSTASAAAATRASSGYCKSTDASFSGWTGSAIAAPALHELIARMLGGVLLLTALQMLLAGTTLPYATRAILYGLVVLGAVMALRERRLQ